MSNSRQIEFFDLLGKICLVLPIPEDMGLTVEAEVTLYDPAILPVVDNMANGASVPPTVLRRDLP